MVERFWRRRNKNKPRRVSDMSESLICLPRNASPPPTSTLLSPLHPRPPPPSPSPFSSGQPQRSRHRSDSASAKTRRPGVARQQQQKITRRVRVCCTHVCVCVPARVLIIKNKHTFPLVGAHANVSEGFNAFTTTSEGLLILSRTKRGNEIQL